MYRTIRLAALISILFAVTVGAEDTPPGPAPPPENAVEFGEHHYLLVDRPEDLSWTAAREACKVIRHHH